MLKILPEKADMILDAAGVPALINQNLKLVKNFGDVCIYGETAKSEYLINWEEAPFCFNLRFAQWPSKAEEAEVHDEIIALIKQGVLKGSNYISDVFDFKDSVEAIEYFKAKKSFNWENSLLRTLESMNNLNFFLTIAMAHIAILVEKKDKNFHSNIILERANSIKKEYLVYLSTMATGIVEILKYARTGIRDWHTKKDKNKGQLQFKLILE